MTHSSAPQNAPAASGEAGFTLLELLVSLALLALLAGLIAGGLGFGRRVWRATGDLDRLSSISAVRQVLADRLAEAMPLADPGAGGVPRLAFRGDSREVAFVTPMPGRRGPAGLYRTVLRWQGGAGGGRLELEQSVFQATTDGSVPGPRAHRLLGGVQGLSLRYFGATKAGEPATWHPAWDVPNRLPRLIGLSLAFAPGEPASWPELIVPLRLTADR